MVLLLPVFSLPANKIAPIIRQTIDVAAIAITFATGLNGTTLAYSGIYNRARGQGSISLIKHNCQRIGVDSRLKLTLVNVCVDFSGCDALVTENLLKASGYPLCRICTSASRWCAHIV